MNHNDTFSPAPLDVGLNATIDTPAFVPPQNGAHTMVAPTGGSSDADLLLEEFTHRINNEFTALIALVSRELENAPVTPTSPLQRLHARLLYWTRVNYALQGPLGSGTADASTYLERLCQNLAIATPCNAQLAFIGGDCWMESRRCWRLGLIVSELVQSACRHSFLGALGTIDVHLIASPDWIQCRVADSGLDAQSPSRDRGFLLVQALVSRLGGQFRRHSGPGGTTCTVSIPR